MPVVSADVFELLTPIDSESKWVSLLATCLALSPSVLESLLGAECSRVKKVHCEYQSRIDGNKDRADIYIESMAADVIIECKVLSAINPSQLERYETSFPDAKYRVVVSPQRIRPPVDIRPGWIYLTWEELFERIAVNPNPWLTSTVEMWSESLKRQLPDVQGSTPWNLVGPDEPFILAMRARVVWIAHSLVGSETVKPRFGQSSKGVSWTTGFDTSAGRDGYRLVLDLEEQLPVQQFPFKSTDSRRLLKGPAIRIFLLQEGVSTSREFDWDHLARLWPTLESSGYEWSGAPKPRAQHDKAGLERMRSLHGVPKFVGIGYGNAQAKLSGSCMFGVKRALNPSLTLSEIADEVNSMKDLLVRLGSQIW